MIGNASRLHSVIAASELSTVNAESITHKWLLKAVYALYPPHCLVCGFRSKLTVDLCETCLTKLPWIQHACRQCGIPLNADSVDLCGVCIRTSPFFDAVHAPLIYESPISDFIIQFKLYKRLHYGRLLGELLARTLAKTIATKPDVLIPIPLHRARISKRGFNQALELSRVIGKRLNIPIDYKSVIRHKDTRAQMGLPATKRITNVKSAFLIIERLRYKHVAIVDDVITTSATVNELAKIFKQRGIEKVEVWSCARAI